MLRLIEANRRITSTLELEAVLQEIVDCACALTSARYGVLALFDDQGGFSDTITSGVDAHQLSRMTTPPVGRGLLGFLNEVDGPLRVADISKHPRSAGLPEDHPPMKTFLGVRVHHESGHLGNIYLAEKGDGEEFTELDEDVITRFAAQAGAAIVNARKFERERRIKTDLKALVKIAPVGLVVFDAKTGAVLTSNQECQRIGGVVGSNAKSWQETFEHVQMYRSDGRLLPVGDRPATQVLQSGEIVRGEEISLHFSDGRIVDTLINAAPIYSERGDIVSVVVAMQDMALMQDSGRMRAEHVGMVSHELRMPLTTIKGSVVALSDIVDSLNTAEPQQLLHIIDHQAEVMRTHINTLIELSDIEAGKMALSLEPADVSMLVADGIREFGRYHSGITLHQNIPDDLPPVMVDKALISQVLRNMLAHVFKYSSQASTVTVTAEHEESHVEFTVALHSDRAHASQPPELIERMRSVAGDEAMQSYVGDGLALTICRRIVGAHRGWFTGEVTECGHGSDFTFAVPVAETALLENDGLQGAVEDVRPGADSAHRERSDDYYAVGQVAVDYASRELAVNGLPVQLTATEYKLLRQLTKKSGRTLTQDELLRGVWGPEYRGESQLLRAYIKSLRQKLGDDARKPRYIFTEHGVGYRMAKA